MKASIYELIAVILAGVVWVNAIMMATALVLLMKTSLLVSEVLIVFGGCMLFILPCLYVINLCNKKRDLALGYIQPKKKVRVYRWVKNIVFSSLVLACLDAIVTLFAGEETVNSQVQNSIWLVLVAVAFAIIMYLKDYARFIDDFGSRLHKVTYKFVINRTRRYTFVVESQKKLSNAFEYVGTIHGEIRVGDICYLYHPSIQARKVKILGLIVNGNSVKSAKDCDVTVVVSNKALQDVVVPPYAVLTSMLAYSSMIVEKELDNEEPYLLGLMAEYAKFYKDNVYYNLFVYAVTHGKFLAIGTTDMDIDNKIMMRQREGVSYGLHSVSPIGEKMNLLPVFTDWCAASRWTDTINYEKAIAVITSFQQLVDIMRSGNFDGIAINPFGPVSNTLRKDIVDEIVSLPGYKKEFDRGE